MAELRFDIPQMYKFHKKKSVDVEVAPPHSPSPFPRWRGMVQRSAEVGRGAEW